MRLRALDRQLPYGAIAAFVVAGTISFFCIVATILFLATAAFADPVMGPRCSIDRVTFTQAMRETRHPLIFVFPPDLSRRFITAWNAGMRGFGVDPSTDGVAIYDYPASPFFKLAFFKGDCLVAAFDVPEGTFWQAVGAADDTKWRI